MKTCAATTRVVRIDDREFPYATPWDGTPLTSRGYLAFDTETEAFDGGPVVPRLALASASAGPSANCLVHPDQVAAFVLAHPRARWVCHNCAFDFWVVDRHLRDRGEAAARRAWWDACDQNRLSDTMLLDQLVELARRGACPKPRDLAAVGRAYARMEISKDDPYRLRYGEIIGAAWDEVEEGFFTYAIKDAIVTLRAYQAMDLEAHRLLDGVGRGCPDLSADTVERFGVLSLSVQVKGAVALAGVSRNGMCLDLDRVRASEAEVRAALEGSLADLRARRPDLFRTRVDRATGRPVPCVSKKTGTPSRSDKVLQKELARVADELGRRAGQPLPIPRTSKGISKSVKVWSEYAHLDPLLGAWVVYEKQTTLCQFFAGLREPVVRPSYHVLQRTGRTSCSTPNVQQVPRDGRFRQAFVASPGHLLLAVDYSYVELVTLAAVCLKRYGRSVLADVIRAGVDPHCYTASMVLGVPLEQFMGWKAYDTEAEVNGVRRPLRDHFKVARQAAKPVNFGVPGGLGAASLVAYARHTYKVEMTLEQAQAFRSKLITEVYPELDRYLSEDGMAVLAGNLGAPAEQLWEALDPRGDRAPFVAAGVRNVVSGKAVNAQGRPYTEGYLNRVWGALIRCCRDPDLRGELARGQGSKALADRLFRTGVVTLTGRVRAGVEYSQSRNTPFQGLASDGAKLALWALTREGFRVVGFVHDEVLIEVPDRGGYADLAEVERVEAVMCGAMRSVLVGDLPVECEATLSRRWSKDAKRVVEGDRVLPWEPKAG
jgi:hypothetical protein